MKKKNINSSKINLITQGFPLISLHIEIIATMPQSYYSTRHDFYEKIMFPNRTELTIGIVESKNQIETLQHISFKDFPFGITQTEVELRIGTPRFIIKKSKAAPVVFFYKENFLEREIILQLFFFDSKLIQATQTIFDTNADWKKNIKQFVIEKYDSRSVIKDFSQNEYTFKDNHNNFISIVDRVNLNITYISGDREDLKQIDDYNRLFVDDKSDAIKKIRDFTFARF